MLLSQAYEATSCSWRSRSLISSLSLAAFSNLSSSAASNISAWRSAMRFWSSSGSRGVSRAAFWRWVLYRPLASAAMRMSETPFTMVRLYVVLLVVGDLDLTPAVRLPYGDPHRLGLL